MKWISAHDKLPDIGKNVIFRTNTGLVGEGNRTEHHWIQYRWASKIPNDIVTHWAEMPGSTINDDDITVTIKEDRITMKFYDYITKERPPMPDTCPRDGLCEVEQFECIKRMFGIWGWGVVTYNRPLTQQEIEDYELAPLELGRTPYQVEH